MVLVNTMNAETQRVRQSGAGCGQTSRQAGGRERWGEKGAMYAVGSSCAGPEGARYTLQEKKDRKEVGGSTKGCFNSLLSSVAEQEEEKVTPPVRNYLANLWRMRARMARRGRTRGRSKGREMNTGKGKGRNELVRESDGR